MSRLLALMALPIGACSSGNTATAPGAQGVGSGGYDVGVGGNTAAGGSSSSGGFPSGSENGGVPPITVGSGGAGAAGAGNTGAFGGIGGVGNAGGVGNSGAVGGFGNTGGIAPGGASSAGGAIAAGGSVADGGGGGTVPPSMGCAGETMPPVTGDYSANGPMQSTVVNNTGSDGNYTIYRPVTLGQNGFKHPVATWGNGITTDPSYYPGLLGGLASHGFVVIASNSTTVTTDLMTSGLDWMVAQNDVAGDYQGKLDVTCLVTVGYSLGGGAAVGAGAHANVVATASMHGVTGASNALHAPLLLLTAQTDTFVTPAGFVTPTFDMSSVETFYGTLSSAADTSNEGHLIPVDGALSLITSTAANLDERAAVFAWLRLWVYADQGAKKYFYGDDCILCTDPWVMPQRKNWTP
ncbi:MAG TPA: hypothetical protein VH142_14125 [Polyangiaceae bacterium]|jgi:hypothetical protein|nr:hypothetical protein [Polyangiaceae bacterium]